MKRNQINGWPGKRLLAALLCVLMLFALSGCGGDKLGNMADRAWKECSRAYTVEEAYHYQFQGQDALNAQVGGTLRQVFQYAQIPNNGHLFFFIAREEPGTVERLFFVLSDEKGNALEAVYYNDVTTMYEITNTVINTQLNEINELYRNGKVTGAFVESQRQKLAAKAAENEVLAVRANIMSKYRYYALSSARSATAEPNRWHELTREQVSKLSWR